jgi:predicted Fe-Mo cluster-binding NifX family protein
MKVCLPTLDSRGLESQISQHFGSAPFYLIVDTESLEYQELPNKLRKHGNGNCHYFSGLRMAGIENLIVQDLGRGALQKLQAADSRVYKTPHRLVGESIEALKKSLLPEMRIDDVCQHGRHHRQLKRHCGE